MVGQVSHGCVVKHLLFDVVARLFERLWLNILQLIKQVSQKGECTWVKGAFAESLRQICLPWNIKLRFARRTDQAKQFDGVLLQLNKFIIGFGRVFALQEC